MDHAAPHVHRIAAQSTLDERVHSLQPDIAYLQHIASLIYQCRAHLDRGRTRLGVDAAPVRHAHDKVEVAHHFAEDAGRYPFEGDRLPVAALCEVEVLDGEAVYVCGGVEAFYEVDPGRDACIVEGALD